MSINAFDVISAVNSSQAASNSAAAKRAAEAAQDASEERLSGQAVMIPVPTRKLEDVPFAGTGFWAKFFYVAPQKLSDTVEKIVLKSTDISHMTEGKDELGTKFTYLHLESRANVEGPLIVKESIDDLTNYVNNFITNGVKK